MRWPFRRRGADAPAPAPAAVSAPAAPVVAPRRAWQALPPLTPVVGPPTLLTPAGLPRVSGTRSLLHRPAAGPPETPAGRVEGLADTLPALDLGGAAEPLPAPAPPRRVTPVERPAAPPSLTHATDEYVGPAREPAEPYRAPAWLRALSTAPVMDPLLGAIPSMPAPPPPAPAAPPRPAPRPAQPRARRPRGRVGLGAPLTGDEHADPDPALAHLLTPTVGPVVGPASAVPAPPVPVRRPATEPRAAASTSPPGPLSAPQPAPSPRRPAAASEGEAAEPPRPIRPAAPIRPTAPVHPAAPSAPPAPPAPVRPARPAPAPAQLARDLGAHLGAELSAVPVHRSSDVDTRAAALGAAAWAENDAVHLPTAAGHVDGAEARALIAHELVHVAQQRALGPALPDEGSPAGAALEAQALAVEAAVRAGAPLPGLTHPPPRAVTTAAPGAAPATAGAALPVPRPLVPATTPAAQAAVPGRVQRRAATLSHPSAPSAPAAAPTAAAPAAPPRAEAAAPAAAPAAAQATAPAAAAPAAGGGPRNWDDFGGVVASSFGGFVFDAWSMDDPTQPASGSGGRRTGGGSFAGPAGGGSAGGGSAGGAERFQQAYDDRLAAINDERAARGESPLAELSHDEQQRIADRTGHHGGPARAEPIRSAAELRDALTNDVITEIGAPFGMDVTPLLQGGQGDRNAAAGDSRDGRDGVERSATDAGRTPVDTDDLDLDEIAGRLYDRIRSRLRLELLLDRERAGLLSDFR